MPAIELTFDRPVRDISLPFVEFAQAMHLTFEESLMRNAKGMIRRVMGITPPGTADGADGGLNSDGKTRGEAAIARDLENIFTGVTLKHKRKEQWPDPAAIHLRLFINQGSGVRSDRGRGYYHVDRTKLKALYVDLKSHVGRMAAGWMPAANALSLSAPAWVTRHGSAGTFSVVRDSDGISVMASNRSMFPKLMAEMERRLPYATEYQLHAMQKEMQVVIEKEAAKLGRDLRSLFAA